MKLRLLASQHAYTVLGIIFCLILVVQMVSEFLPATATSQPANVASLTKKIGDALVQKKYTLAKQLSEDYIKLNPEVAEGYFLLAQSEFHSGNIRQASNYTITATELDPTNPTYRLFLSDTYIVIGWIPKAEEQITFALEIEPENLSYLVRRAELLMMMGKMDKAMEDINYGISVSNGDPDLILRRADLFWRSTQIEEAKNDLNFVIANYTGEKAKIAAEILERIENR